MLSTGVIRKIDDLGRLVIPKEIRKNLNIKNDEELEIFIDGEKIILQKYKKLQSFKSWIDIYVSFLEKLTDNLIVITDREKIISSSNKNYENELLNKVFDDKLSERKEMEVYDIFLNTHINLKNKSFIIPIIVNADLLGSLIMNGEIFTQNDKILLKFLEEVIKLNFNYD